MEIMQELLNIPSPSHLLNSELLKNKQLKLWVKRDDLIHKDISGNKWRKLKYNIEAAKKQGNNQLLTFGGAYSNHIAATAAVGKVAGIKTIGVIRGNEFSSLNSTLTFAKENEMSLHFVSRNEYKRKTEDEFLKMLKDEFGPYFLVPEGGANEFGALGCAEILAEENEEYDFICCAAGTGTTASGILNALNENQKLLVFPALKGGDGLKSDILSYFNNANKESQLQMINDYHFGGYAKIKPDLVDFTNSFYEAHQLPLDLIYTAKMMYGLFDLIQKDYFPRQSKILFIHSGGLQGNEGFKNKGIKLIF